MLDVSFDTDCNWVSQLAKSREEHSNSKISNTKRNATSNSTFKTMTTKIARLTPRASNTRAHNEQVVVATTPDPGKGRNTMAAAKKAAKKAPAKKAAAKKAPAKKAAAKKAPAKKAAAKKAPAAKKAVAKKAPAKKAAAKKAPAAKKAVAKKAPAKKAAKKATKKAAKK
jgi:hypothetical protein